jgi:hypothetical protein
VSVRTAPGAQCSIAYITPAGTASTAQGLVPMVANSSGMVSWTWAIGSGL